LLVVICEWTGKGYYACHMSTVLAFPFAMARVPSASNHVIPLG
jgi:hypothetical protein